jgi:hypothetical protein
MGRDPCCPPAPDPRGDAGAVFDEVESVVLLKATALTARQPYCIQPRHGKAVDTEALTSQGSKPFSSDDDGGLSDSDPDLGSDDDGCSSEDEQGRSRTSKHSPAGGQAVAQALCAY